MENENIIDIEDKIIMSKKNKIIISETEYMKARFWSYFWIITGILFTCISCLSLPSTAITIVRIFAAIHLIYGGVLFVSMMHKRARHVQLLNEFKAIKAMYNNKKEY